MSQHKVMMSRQVNYRIVHCRCRIICVEVQLTIFKSACTNAPVRHTHLQKTKLITMDRTTETNMNMSSLVNHMILSTSTEETESVMVDNFMDEVETFMTF